MTEMTESLFVPPNRADIRRHGVNLFIIGFIVLFFELASIRASASYVVSLNFFTNLVLIGSFLGLSCGCLAARQRRDWLAYFPVIAAATVLAAIVLYIVYHFWSGFVVGVGGQRSPQEVFFGTRDENPDLAKFIVPIEAIAGFFFVLVALMFAGFGQALGRAFDGYPNRIKGYTLNIGGSLVGIAAFSALSFLQTPPGVWFLISACGVAYLLRQTGALTWFRALTLVMLVLAIGEHDGWLAGPGGERFWSPYYMVDHDIGSGLISVNNIGHQRMFSFSSGRSFYSLIHLLQRQSGGPPFRDVLVIGAGSGNDVAQALRFGAKRVDAVEIDPAILNIGRRYHPDRPYQDSRVVTHLDDGRHFLRTTRRKYDLLVYALVDSLILHSSYANLRLESYLFTQQAFQDVRRVLKPNGIFVTYNWFRQGWIVQRIAAMLDKTFGCRPLVINLPYQRDLETSYLNSFTVAIGGCHTPISVAFSRHQNFWMSLTPARNLQLDGFAINPASMPAEQAGDFERVSPTSVTYSPNTATTTDDWPFLYLRGRLIPDFIVRSMVILGILGLGMVYLFLPKGRISIDSRMFFLGAAFMLLETRAVTEMSLLFGSTWLVNSSVFFTILVLILLANIYVLQVAGINLFRHYLGLTAVIIAGALVPPAVFLTGGVLWRYFAPCFFTLAPVFFAGVIFARSFRSATRPELALGANIAGSVVGGLAESFSTVLGFQHLLLVALVFYLLSAWSPRVRKVAVRS
jgi:SAM-dependent methyltransferase